MKKVWYWAMYDFANSIVMIAFLFYFSQWLVIDQGKPVWWYNMALVIPSLLFLVTAPFIGRYIDRTGKKIGGLRVTTILSIILFTLVSFVTLFSSYALLAVGLYAIAMFVYLLSFLYYTPMLNDLATENNMGRISGIGQGVNSLGQVIGLLVTIPFVSGTITLFGAPGRAQTLLPSAILFGLLTLPMLLWYRDPAREEVSITEKQLPSRSPFAIFKDIFLNKRLGLLLVGYFFFSDALLTFSNNFPLYLEQVHAVPDTTKAIFTLIILSFAALGAYIFGRIADRKGHQKVLLIILGIWCFIFPAFAFAQSFLLVAVLCFVAGIFYGPVWGISRAMVGSLSPKEITASSFGYYVIAERFATLIGPILWSIGLGLGGGGTMRGYQYALLSMSVLVIVGWFFVKKMKN